jgi:hypothetical protein
MELCTLSDEVKAKLTVVFSKYDHLGCPDAKKEYGAIGVSENDWLKFCCDKLGIIGIDVD